VAQGEEQGGTANTIVQAARQHAMPAESHHALGYGGGLPYLHAKGFGCLT
jgi:hypothetical protein